MSERSQVNRRQFGAGALGAIAGSTLIGDRSMAAVKQSSPQFFVASVGASLRSYMIDPSAGALRQIAGPLDTPAEVQACWQHPTDRILYVASSDQNTTKTGRHTLQAVSVGADGALAPHGATIALDARPIFVTVDHRGRYIIAAFNRPSGVAVYRIAPDGNVGDRVVQHEPLDTGTYAHQVRIMPSNRAVLVMARGNDATAATAEDPGSLHIFAFADGQLSPRQVVRPNGGVGFRPRHADFHPSGKWAYIDLESQNVVQTYALRDDRLSEQPLAQATTLASAIPKPGQLASAIMTAAHGRTLYVANRGTGTEPFAGQRVSNGGENSIAVFALDPATGAPRHAQTAEAHGVHVRTMALSIDGTWLVAASIASANVRRGDAVEEVPGGLSLFRVAADGRLTFAGKTAIAAPGQSIFWSGAIRV